MKRKRYGREKEFWIFIGTVFGTLLKILKNSTFYDKIFTKHISRNSAVAVLYFMFVLKIHAFISRKRQGFSVLLQ